MASQFKSITATEKVYLSIKEHIIKGKYLPGVHLVETDLLKEYGVSRVTIRDALRRLVDDGIVELIPHRGIIVRKLSKKEIKDMYIILEYLEGLAVRLLIESNNNDIIEELERIHSEDTKAVNNQDFDLHLRLVIDFHDKIASSTGNSALIKILNQFHVINSIHYATLPLKQRMKDSLQEHRNILNAIIAHDTDLAESLMRARIRAGISLISNSMDE